QTQQSQGGRIQKELPIQVSNLALVDPKDGGPPRVGFKILEDGKKVRFAKKSGEVIDG
ncbi:MAG: 50S ribosomal protein L24, partial [Pseudomonadota bacterium]